MYSSKGHQTRSVRAAFLLLGCNRDNSLHKMTLWYTQILSVSHHLMSLSFSSLSVLISNLPIFSRDGLKSWLSNSGLRRDLDSVAWTMDYQGQNGTGRSVNYFWWLELRISPLDSNPGRCVDDLRKDMKVLFLDSRSDLGFAKIQWQQNTDIMIIPHAKQGNVQLDMLPLLWAIIGKGSRDCHALWPMNCSDNDQSQWDLPVLKFHSIGYFVHWNSDQHPLSPVAKLYNNRVIAELFCRISSFFCQSRCYVKASQ